MKNVFALFVAVNVLAGCALWPSWHWEKAGATADELTWDQNQCKAKVYAGSTGMVTDATVRRMQYCMGARGWHRVEH